ncbi:galactose-3-O-sulfotransferase 2 [Colius striatus]|uniref:galactose-3-O-sulfotransferase 2 n=1 Tax=Colius striatus TaxID=57412 RepID=UPI002B1E539D|nr:galactose-3-O-sulfotransferase 2 [Colius striatus]
MLVHKCRHLKWLVAFSLCLGLILLSGFFHVEDNNSIVARRQEELAGAPCRARTNVMFLKTHKTASSTVLNLLFRFTERHELTVALPAQQLLHLGYPSSFLAHFVEDFQSIGQNYNIMGNHLRFNPSEVRKVMAANTFYFSILRNPIRLLESSYVYYKNVVPAFRASKDVNEYLASPLRYYWRADRQQNIYARNIMWFDFGYDNNAEDDGRSRESVQALSPESEERVKAWCSLDWELYLHFNQSFWRRVEEAIGLEQLHKEVDELRARQKELMETCLSEQEAVGKDHIKDKALLPFQSGAANILGYNLRQDLDNRTLRTCQRMVMPELQYMSQLYSAQHPHKRRKQLRLPLP